MIDYKHFNLFTQDSVDKQVLIEYDGGTITNTELFAESIEITESLCSEKELRFGACEASIIKFKVANVVIPLFNKWITVKMYLNGNSDEPLQIGRYKVYSDKPTADRKWREIVAYDAMYDILNANVAGWYNTILPNDNSKITMKAFRTGFLNHFGITQEETELVNDSMTVEKTILPDEISGRDVITAICEINGCFGHITRDGTFKYIYLDRDIQGLYPRNDLYPDNNLFPRNPSTQNIAANGGYVSAGYEDFTTKTIDKLQIRKEENDIGVIIGGDNAQNAYIIEDNFLVYGKSTEELQAIADNIFNKIAMIIYRPFNAVAKGNPCIEVGDAVRLFTRYELIESYVLQRTLKGIQALRDSFSAKGVEVYGEKVNSLHKSIIELKGKSNVLARTIEETQSTISYVQKGLQSQITQTANAIAAEVTRATTEEERLSSKIIQNADSITAEVTRATTKEGMMSSKITQNAEQIVLKIDSNGKITQVKLSGNADEGTEFVVKADNINLTASEVLNFLSNGVINLTGKKIKITSDYFKVDDKGNVICDSIECNNITAFSISGDAISQFSTTVYDSNALVLARQAINTAQNAANTAQTTATYAKNTANFSYRSIQLINQWILQISSQLVALGQPGISGGLEDFPEYQE